MKSLSAYARSRHTWRAALLSVLLTALLLAIAAPPSAALTPGEHGKVLADLGFRPARDGFGFANYGAEYPQGNLTTDDARLLFGDQVCKKVEKDVCEPSPATALWVEVMNHSMQNGHSEGMAALSLLLFTGKERIAGHSGSVYDLPPTNVETLRKIARYWATQTLPPLRTQVQRSTQHTPAQILWTLLADLKSGAETYTLGLYGPRAHTVTPYAVEFVGDDIYWVHVYDNNFPGVGKYVAINVRNEEWTYAGNAADPANDSAPWSGRVGTLELTPTSARQQTFPCPFVRQQMAPEFHVIIDSVWDVSQIVVETDRQFGIQQPIFRLKGQNSGSSRSIGQTSLSSGQASVGSANRPEIVDPALSQAIQKVSFNIQMESAYLDDLSVPGPNAPYWDWQDMQQKLSLQGAFENSGLKECHSTECDLKQTVRDAYKYLGIDVEKSNLENAKGWQANLVTEQAKVDMQSPFWEQEDISEEIGSLNRQIQEVKNDPNLNARTRDQQVRLLQARIKAGLEVRSTKPSRSERLQKEAEAKAAEQARAVQWQKDFDERMRQGYIEAKKQAEEERQKYNNKLIEEERSRNIAQMKMEHEMKLRYEAYQAENDRRAAQATAQDFLNQLKREEEQARLLAEETARRVANEKAWEELVARSEERWARQGEVSAREHAALAAANTLREDKGLSKEDVQRKLAERAKEDQRKQTWVSVISPDGVVVMKLADETDNGVTLDLNALDGRLHAEFSKETDPTVVVATNTPGEPDGTYTFRNLKASPKDGGFTLSFPPGGGNTVGFYTDAPGMQTPDVDGQFGAGPNTRRTVYQPTTAPFVAGPSQPEQSAGKTAPPRRYEGSGDPAFDDLVNQYIDRMRGPMNDATGANSNNSGSGENRLNGNVSLGIGVNQE